MRRIAAVCAIALCSAAALADESAWTSTTMTTIRRHWYTFEPKPDITTYELARATLVLATAAANRNPFRDNSALVDDLPPDVKRHFVEHNE